LRTHKALVKGTEEEICLPSVASIYYFVSWKWYCCISLWQKVYQKAASKSWPPYSLIDQKPMLYPHQHASTSVPGNYLKTSAWPHSTHVTLTRTRILRRHHWARRRRKTHWFSWQWKLYVLCNSYVWNTPNL